jgi:hypothetical protein
VVLTTTVARADITVSTLGSINGDIGSWGTPDSSATPSYGEMFVDPAGNPFLQSATFMISNANASSIPYQAYVYSWTGSAITGSALFTSSPQSVAPTGSVSTFAANTISSMNTLLIPGNSYIVLFSTIGFTGPLGGARWQTATQASYPQGAFDYNNSATFAGLFAPPNPPWNNNGTFGPNLAFSLSFTSPAAPSAPEPRMLASTGLAGVIGVLALVRHRRRQRAA